MRIYLVCFIIFCSLITSFPVSSQTTNYKKDFLILDSLTKGFATYSVKLITQDTLASLRNGDQLELITTFRFLKRKKHVQKNPDVTFNIFIDNILLNYPSAIIEPNTSSNPNVRYVQDRYKVIVNYVLSIALQAVTKEGAKYYITLISNEDYQKKFYVAIPDPSDNTMGVTRTDVGSIIQTYAQKFTINIPNFMTDFNLALLEYRRK